MIAEEALSFSQWLGTVFSFHTFKNIFSYEIRYCSR